MLLPLCVWDELTEKLGEMCLDRRHHRVQQNYRCRCRCNNFVSRKVIGLIGNWQLLFPQAIFWFHHIFQCEDHGSDFLILASKV